MKALAETGRELRNRLVSGILRPWFPACVATQGFHQDFDRAWRSLPGRAPTVVFQARMTWLAASLAEEPDLADQFRPLALHGHQFLRDHFVAPSSGAMRWSTSDDVERHAYGQAFAIYALAAVARSLAMEEALELAKSAFSYVERCHWDREHGGYFEVTDAAGSPRLEGRGKDAIGTPYGLKSQNTHLHLLEAYAELARVLPDDLVLERLQFLVELFLGALYVEPGWLHVYAERDWRPVPGDVSHGHDVEAAHLVLDASRVLGRRDADVEPFVRSVLNYALATGWHEAGGFYYTGRPGGGVVDDTKVWWAQAEGLLGLATGYRLTGEARYGEAMLDQWRWIRDHQIDDVHGGWHEAVAPDGSVIGHDHKGHAWKAAYHDGRALLFTSRLLQSEVSE